MPILDLVALPARLGVAAGQATLALGRLAAPDGVVRRPGGYAERIMLVIGEDGLVERAARALSDPRGPMALFAALAAATAPDRPLGRAIAADGAVDRLLHEDGPLARLLAEDGVLDHLLAEDGPVERLLARDGALDTLVAEDGPLERLLAAGGALDRITRPGGVLERLLREGGLLDRLISEDGLLEKLLADGGTLDQLVALGGTLEDIQPRLAELSAVIPQLHASVDTLSRAVEPLGDLAGRLPRSRRRATSAPEQAPERPPAARG